MRKSKVLVGDFETTVYKGQEFTEVWASAVVEVGTEDVKIFHSLADTLDYLISLKENVSIYYHNLKFDGSFWLDYLMKNKKYKQAIRRVGDDEVRDIIFKEEKDMYNNEFKYSISDMGQWYSITIKVGGHIIMLKDSLKLLPFSVKQIGKAFNTKHQKLEMEYEGFRYSGCEITEEEKKYIANDVLVVAEALQVMFTEGHDKLTIGACCLGEYKKIVGSSAKIPYDWEELFPDLSQLKPEEMPEEFNNADEYIRKSYRGGWCYVVEEKAHKIFEEGVTADVNSLYPSEMHSESGNAYPIGLPIFWQGNYIPNEATGKDKYYFVRIKTRFYLKHNYLPFVQIKSNLLYKGNECLRTSDVYDSVTGKYYKFLKNSEGEVEDTRVTLTLTCTDYNLLKEHYDLEDFEILDGCYFNSMVGIFDEYIDKYKKIKMESKGARRTLAKLFLNNLYGKMASSTNSSFKVGTLVDDIVCFYTIPQFEKQCGFIPVGSAITSYARNFTIRTAQKNYYGVDKRGFIYADTDSIHCDLAPEELTGLKVDDNAFCCWKLEACWDKGIFVRQKTYIEHVTHEDMKEIEQPYYNVKCAGMPKKCKDLFVESLERTHKLEQYTEEEEKFIKQKRTLEDFDVGLLVPSKLMPKRISGGVLLVNTTYEMR